MAPGAPGQVGRHVVGGRPFWGGARALQGSYTGGALWAEPQCSLHAFSYAGDTKLTIPLSMV